MDIDAAQQMLHDLHHAVLATVRRSGDPQLSPVVVALDAAGRATVSTREPSYKVRNIRGDPRVWMCVLPDGFFGNWVRIDGRAEIVPLPEAMDGLKETYRAVAGAEHPDWAEFERAQRDERRVLLRIQILAAGPDRSG
jgi:PPOX class probable F420-dependent enzyme